jgi:hypothetical protein
VNERELAQALDSGLAGVSLFRWGWAALESDQVPPSLPLVTLTRLNANVAALDDMCEQDADVEGETTCETHVWRAGYEEARMLQDQVRAIVIATGWRLQSEQDAYDGLFHAWRISAQWLNMGPLFVGDALPPAVPDEEGTRALFILLHEYIPPVPPPVRAFSSGFDGGFQ